MISSHLMRRRFKEPREFRSFRKILIADNVSV
jgi:hypothetical protein